MLNLVRSKGLFARLAFLALGGTALFFANGLYVHVVAAWLAPLFLLRFSRLSGPFAGFAAIAAVTAATSFFNSHGMMPVPDGEFAVACVIAGVIAALIYLADRLMAARIGGILGSLVFPSAYVCVLYLVSFNPFGTWGNDAYAQYDFLVFAQLASLGGLWAVQFMAAWFASAMQPVFNGERRTAGVYAVAFAAALVFGAARLAVPQEDAAPVKIATLANPPDLNAFFLQACEDEGDDDCRKAASDARLDVLFALSEDAADKGAKIIVWYEGAAQYDESLERNFIDRASAFATARDIYLVVGALVFPQQPADLLVNKAMAFAPGAGLAGEYIKAAPVPGEPIVKGSGDITRIETPYGALAMLICFDADFPALARKAAGAGLVLIPSNDWEAITPIHGEMAAFRAIENGYAIARAASNGLSIAVDAKGRMIASSNSFASDDAVMLADVPVQPRATLYARIGDAFALACIAALGLFVAGSIALSRRRERQNRRGGSS